MEKHDELTEFVTSTMQYFTEQISIVDVMGILTDNGYGTLQSLLDLVRPSGNAEVDHRKRTQLGTLLQDHCNFDLQQKDTFTCALVRRRGSQVHCLVSFGQF